MKRKYLYAYKQMLDQVINNSKTIKLNSQFLFVCLKNRKLIQQEIELFDKQFDPNEIQGFKEYLEDQSKLINKFKEDNRERIEKQENLEELQKELSVIIQKNKFQNYKDLVKALQKLNMQKLEFLQKEYEDAEKIIRFKLNQLPTQLDKTMQVFMEVFIDIID